MTEEEKIAEQEKSRDKYFYIDKEKTCQVLTSIATSFIGASIALLLFASTHKPPEPRYHGPFMQPPCKCKMMHEYRGGHGMHKRHGDFKNKHFYKGDFRKLDKKAIPPAPKTNK